MMDEGAVRAILDAGAEAAGAEQTLVKRHGHTFVVHGSDVQRIPDPTETHAQTLTVADLAGVVAALETVPDATRMILTVDPYRVAAITEPDRYGGRGTWVATARRTDAGPGLIEYTSARRFIAIALAELHPSENRAKMLEIVGNARAEGAVETEDDGVAQSVTTRATVALRGVAEIPSPLTLAPIRGFPEVGGIESAYFLRAGKVGEGEGARLQFRLEEYGEPAWRVASIRAVRAWLAERIDKRHVIA